MFGRLTVGRFRYVANRPIRVEPTTYVICQHPRTKLYWCDPYGTRRVSKNVWQGWGRRQSAWRFRDRQTAIDQADRELGTRLILYEIQM